MLTSLSITNIVLIDRLELSFSNGFGVLTGETGAGKSILLGALGFVLGNKSAAGLLRSGEKQGSISACFGVGNNDEITSFLAANGLENQGELILRRVIYEDGKSKAFVNDSPVSVATLSSLASHLVEIHGQHDQRGLLDQSGHREILDAYGAYGKKLTALSDVYELYKKLQDELAELESLAAKSASEEDYLSYIIKELEQLRPVAGEELSLAEKRSRLMNSEKTSGSVTAAVEILEEANIATTLTRAQGYLQDAIKAEPKLQGVVEALERAVIEVEEASATLDSISANMGGGEENLESIEERLFALRGAARKYRVNVDELSAYMEEVRQKLDNIRNKEIRIAEVAKKLMAAKAAYLEAAKNLSTERSKVSTQFEKKLHAELAPLKMENARFKVSIEELPETSWNKYGIDKISFLVQTNPGMPFAPLAKIASGGELSRFMLAMKVVLSGVKSVPTLIFDEIDTGIGGAVADSVGKRMELLGKSFQVLAVTHHAQVAARSSFHLKIAKKITKGQTLTGVKELTGEEKQHEIARMLAGEEITEEAVAAAGRLMV